MIARIHPISAFRDNYIWTLLGGGGRGEEEGKACVVDPGDAGPVLDFLAAEGLRLTDILITHHHWDHTGGLPALIEKHRPRVHGPAGIDDVERVLTEGDRVEILGVDFDVLEVPGHTLDHIAYFHDGGRHDTPILLCGDTLFAAGCGRLFEGAPAQMLTSLRKLAAMPPATAVYCTHEYTMANLDFAAAAEPSNQRLRTRIAEEQRKRDSGLPTLPSSIELELATNPFLRCGRPELAASAARRLGRRAADETEVFAAIRQWKDQF